MKLLSDDEVRAAIALADAATPGEWRIDHDRNEQATIHAGDSWVALLPHQCVESIRLEREHDAAFIAASRTLVPELGAEVLRLRATLAALIFSRQKPTDFGGGHEPH